MNDKKKKARQKYATIVANESNEKIKAKIDMTRSYTTAKEGHANIGAMGVEIGGGARLESGHHIVETGFVEIFPHRYFTFSNPEKRTPVYLSVMIGSNVIAKDVPTDCGIHWLVDKRGQLCEFGPNDMSKILDRGQFGHELVDEPSSGVSNTEVTASKATLDEDQDLDKQFKSKLAVDTERKGNAVGGTAKSDDSKAPLNDKISRKINIQHKEDTSSICFITGSTLLTNRTLALADDNNKSVKIVDLRSDTITTHIKLDSRLHDMTSVDANTLVVIMDKRLAFLHCNKDIQLGKQIEVDDGCQGIAYSQNKLFVTFAGDKKECVKVLNMDGEVIQTFKTDTQGKDLFHNPRYIAVSKDGETIFVSDFSNSRVTCLGSDGTVIGVYKHADLWRNAGVAVVGNTCYVAGWLSHNVHRITPQGIHMRVALDKSDGLETPWALAHNLTFNILYICCARSNFVSVLNLA